MESVTVNDGKLSWKARGDAKAFLVECDGIYVSIMDGTDTSLALAGLPEGVYTVRAANMRGGFGAPRRAVAGDSGVTSVIGDDGAPAPRWTVTGQPATPGYRGIVVSGGRKTLAR